MERFLALHEFEPEARQRLPHAVYEYVSGGAGEEHSIRANQESYQRIFLRPRVLRSVTPVDLSQDLFGRPLPAPVLLAPAAYQRLMHPEGELGSVRGANHHGVPFVLSSNGTVSMYTIKVVHGHAWTYSVIWQSPVAKALQDLHQTFGDLSFFLPASDRARVQGVAIGFAPYELKRFRGRFRADLRHLAQNARSLECSRH